MALVEGREPEATSSGDPAGRQDCGIGTGVLPPAQALGLRVQSQRLHCDQEKKVHLVTICWAMGRKNKSKEKTLSPLSVPQTPYKVAIWWPVFLLFELQGRGWTVRT